MPELHPICFALAPLYPAVVNRAHVSVSQPCGTAPFTPVAAVRSYRAVDVEVWARRFLTDLDRVLTPPVWTALRGDSALAETMAQLEATHEVLVEHIADGLIALNPATMIDSEGLARARALLVRQLGVSLTEGYATSLIVRREKAVVPWIISAPVVPTVSPRGTVVASAVMFDPVAGASTAALVVREAGASAAPFALNVLVEGQGGAPSQSAFDPATLPVPLRFSPMPPVLVAQSALVPELATPTLAEAARWTYRLTYAYAPAWQDELLITVGFNATTAISPAREPAAAPVTGNGEDLFAALACYLELTDALAAALLVLATSEGGLSEAQRAVVRLFADTTELIAKRWSVRDQVTIPEAGEIAAEQVSSFVVRVTHRLGAAGQLFLDTVTLIRPAAQAGDESLGWPVITVMDTSNQPVSLARGASSGVVAEYRVATEVGLESSPGFIFRFEWAGLNIATFRDATVQLAVRRNATLAGSDEPDVSDLFCFSAPPVAAATAIEPLIVREGDFPMEGVSLGQALASAIKVLFADADNLLVSFTLAYRHPLNTPGLPEPQRVSLPVLLLPPRLLDDEAFGAMEMVSEQWFAASQPETAGAEWTVSLTLFIGDDAAPRPLLTMSQLVLPVASPLIA